MIIIIPVICTLLFAIIVLAIMPKSVDQFYRISLLLSGYGILIFVTLRNLLGNTTSYSAASSEQSKIMDRLIDQQVGMMSAATAVLLLSLLLAVVFNILQLRVKSKRIYSTTLGTQVVLFIMMLFSFVLSKSFIL